MTIDANAVNAIIILGKQKESTDNENRDRLLCMKQKRFKALPKKPQPQKPSWNGFRNF